MRDVFYSVLKFRDEKQTFAKVEGVKWTCPYYGRGSSPIEWRWRVERRRDKTVVVIREARVATRHAAGHNCSGAGGPSSAGDGSSSGTDPDAAPLLRREGSAHGRARLRRWRRRRPRCCRRRRSGRRSRRPVRPSSSYPAGKALRRLHSLRAVSEAAAWPRQARVRLCIYCLPAASPVLDLCVHMVE